MGFEYVQAPSSAGSGQADGPAGPQYPFPGRANPAGWARRLAL